MGQSRETVRQANLAASVGAPHPTTMVWDAPCIVPFRNMTVVITSRGVEWPVGDLDWEVFYTYRWASGSPFQNGSVPGDGISKGSGTYAGAGQVYEVAYEDASFLPANMRANPTNPSTSLDKTGFAGAAVVCKLTNKMAVAIEVFVSFISETINDIV